MAWEVAPLIPWLVWIVPVAGALLTPVTSLAGDRLKGYIAVLFSLVAALLAAWMLPLALAGETLRDQVIWIPGLGITAGVLADPLSILMANVVAWISFLIMVYSLGYMHGERDLTRYWFFMNLFIGNMLLIVLSDNFLQFFVGWEGVGLCSYALIGFWHSDEEKYWVGTPRQRAWGVAQAYSPSHAGMKAFVTTRVGDVSFLIGLLLLFSYSNTFDFMRLGQTTGWAQGLAGAGLLIPTAVLIFGGAVGKSAQFPLHEWLPDAMAGPTSVSALIHAATMVKAGVFLVARAGPIFYQAAASVQQVAPLFETIAWIGAFTAFLAATQAVVSKEVKKVLAYSTVSQIGYMMLALGAAGLTVDFVSGFTAGFFHLTTHAIFKATMFLAAGSLIHAAGSRFMHEMGGLRKNMKITFAATLIAAASLSGIPPFSGFWSKDAVLAATLEANQLPLFALGVITALITAFYSFRMIGMVFFGPKSAHLEELEQEGHHVREAPAVMWVPYGILAAATVAIGVVGLYFEEGLREIFGEYLQNTFRVAAAPAAGLNLTALGASLSAAGVGSLLGIYIYVNRRLDPVAIVSSSRALTGLYRFLENRWYINAFYYRVFVNGLLSMGSSLFKYLESGVIDRISAATAGGSIWVSKASNKLDVQVVDGTVNGIAGSGARFSRVSRRIQSGITQLYVFAFALGIIFLVFLMLLVA